MTFDSVGFVREVTEQHAHRVALVPWQTEPPVGADRLRAVVRGEAEPAGVIA